MKYIGSMIRTVLALASGYLISAGVEPEAVQKFTDSSEAVLLGLAGYAIAQGWSLLNKKITK